MKIERSISEKTGTITDKIILTAEENSALDSAHEIIKCRAEAEEASYDRERVEWWLMGVLRSEGVTKMLETAKSSPFARKPRSIRGYS